MFPCSQNGYGKKQPPPQSLRTGQGNTVISQLGQIFWGCLQCCLGTLLWTSVYNFQIKGACCFFSGDCNVFLLLASVCGITVSLVFPWFSSIPTWCPNCQSSQCSEPSETEISPLGKTLKSQTTCFFSLSLLREKLRVGNFSPECVLLCLGQRTQLKWVK